MFTEAYTQVSVMGILILMLPAKYRRERVGRGC